jgi:hypothetical protein
LQALLARHLVHHPHKADGVQAGIEAGSQDIAAGRIQPLNVAFDDLRRDSREATRIG